MELTDDLDLNDLNIYAFDQRGQSGVCLAPGQLRRHMHNAQWREQNDCIVDIDCSFVQNWHAFCSGILHRQKNNNNKLFVDKNNLMTC